jgi:hypothetical protein
VRTRALVAHTGLRVCVYAVVWCSVMQFDVCEWCSGGDAQVRRCVCACVCVCVLWCIVG